MNERNHGIHHYHTAKFRSCTKADFESRGVEVNDEFEQIILKRFCPVILANESLYKIRHIYTEQKLRNSISIEIR